MDGNREPLGLPFHGSNRSISRALVRPAAMHSSTSVSQACGSTPFNCW
jgi:hypothetical protein